MKLVYHRNGPAIVEEQERLRGEWFKERLYKAAGAIAGRRYGVSHRYTDNPQDFKDAQAVIDAIGVDVPMRLMSKTEAAAEIGIDQRTVNVHMREGRIPYVTVGKQVVFTWADVQLFKESYWY